MSKIRKITSRKELKALVLERMTLQLEGDKAESLGQPMDVEMNKMVSNKDKGTKKVIPGDPTAVKMNSMESGGKSTTGAQVRVKAGSVKSGTGYTAGQANASMDAKMDSKSSVKAGQPFTTPSKMAMNTMDEEGDDTAKTFAETGEGTVGSQPTTVGQKKASFKEAAPKSKETEKRIADAIQMKEGMKFKNKSDLMNFISEEALRISRII